ncbi:hypothetical protein [Mycobacterium sp. D16Q16]|uniref:hypothetical protein n=1 Tax=Mycobacterium sp. D16Q16 TaxID=1855659 RepID=UPI0009935900|nr:hypothetical protein [Mycobacterium sp. D16Q16]
MTFPHDPGAAELIRHHEKWRHIYSAADQPAPNEPVREENRLIFRDGYPYDGWTAYILEPKGAGYNVLSASTERRNEPHEGVAGYFSTIEEAGKFIIWKSAVGVRVALNLPSISQVWRAAGLDSRVEKIEVSEGIARYRLKARPEIYFEMYSGGIKPENRLLPLTYDELDAVLLEGIPESVDK